MNDNRVIGKSVCKNCKMTREEAGVDYFEGDFCSEDCMDEYYKGGQRK